MPIYEYQCDKCGETTEVLQKFSDNPLSDCPCCGGPMHKLMSMNSFQLKGSGWYVTDYAGKTSSPDKDAKKAPAKESTCASSSDSGACKTCPSAAPASKTE
ncbi:FmdB family transcriptional regulator [Deltaproteobacteria bacterium Smac51]|nr:FmdB family transcriptional regulator [Deltaproteobacteria bacterium Smac51]